MSITKKPRKCRHCKHMFQPTYCGQNTCSFECKVALGVFFAERSKAKREKAERIAEIASTKILREKLKTKSEWMREAQAAVNAYVRIRDDKDPCISCGRYHEGQYHAGHYRSTGSSPALRFDLLNIHKQCMPCNTHLHGNLIPYRVNLIQKIGLAEVERLEGPQEPKKYTIDELKEIISTYRAKTKELKNGD